ncbi:MAG TPA: type I restriction enzyme HsdR N-terminal domain-containing protein [Bacteroidia bacterium]|nr:type I restriction enzyme HsdR N-terminal domain-containing protein [Bacteroidia bacterium]
MYQLNLPAFEYRVKAEAQRKLIFDVVRKKYVSLTPEEWVRQHVIHYLLKEKKVPHSLVGVEKGITILNRPRRTDLVVFNNLGHPMLLVECKSPLITLEPKVMTQAALYNYGYGMDYIMITNGMSHVYLKIDKGLRKIQPVAELPLYPFHQP